MNGILARRISFELSSSVQGLTFLRGLTGVAMTDVVDTKTTALVL
jgi:hypothetical protein